MGSSKPQDWQVVCAFSTLFFISEDSNVKALMSVTDYPVRLNTITVIAFCMEGHLTFNLGLRNAVISKNQLHIILPDQIIHTTEVSPDFKAGFMVVRRNFFDSQNHFIETMNLHHNLMRQSYFDLSESEMQDYIRIVEEHYRKEHSVQFYADKICLTPKYLSSVIHEVSGKHASAWIHEYLVLEAKALLKQSGVTPKDICEILNFCTPSHFGRFFKRYVGCTPGAYKKM